jgi:hypothetical protein
MRWDDRGAITIHVAIALIALITFTSIVVDYGVMWVSRTQAQAAADAGALAGAITLMLDATATGKATAVATHFASANVVWGQATATTDILVSPLPFNCPDGVPSCIRVDVMRGLDNPHDGSAHSNTLPTYFAKMVNINSQGVRATATAQIAKGNAVQCIKPWVVADKWTDNSAAPNNGLGPGWDQMDTFDPAVDTYTARGFSAQTDVGLELMLKGEGKDWSSGWTLEIELGGGNGGNVYRDEISFCPPWVKTIGLWQSPTPCADFQTDQHEEAGCLNVKTGVKAGPTQQGVSNLIGYDPTAYWDTSTNSVAGGCTAAGTCRTQNPLGIDISPRIVPLALFDPASYATLANAQGGVGCSGNGCMARVMNLLGFFVEGMCDQVYATPPPWCGTGPDPAQTVVGRLMPYPGQAKSSSGSAGPDTFLKIVRLIR